MVSRIDGWMYSVSLRYSLIVCLLSQIDGCMDRKCKFEIVCVVSQMYGRMNG